MGFDNNYVKKERKEKGTPIDETFRHTNTNLNHTKGTEVNQEKINTITQLRTQEDNIN